MRARPHEGGFRYTQIGRQWQCMYVCADGAELHRILIWSDGGERQHHRAVSVWKPFSHIVDDTDDVNVWNMQFHTVQQVSLSLLLFLHHK